MLLAIAGALIILHYGIATKTDPAGVRSTFRVNFERGYATEMHWPYTRQSDVRAHRSATRVGSNGCEFAGPATATSRRAVGRDDYAAAATVLRPGTAVEAALLPEQEEAARAPRVGAGAAQRRAVEAVERRAEDA